MTTIKIIALIFALLGIIKMICIFLKPKSWKPVIKVVYGKPVITQIISLLLGAFILRSLLKELTITQIFASMTFLAALMCFQFASISEEVLDMTDKFFDNNKILKKLWLSICIWIALIGWVLFEILI